MKGSVEASRGFERLRGFKRLRGVKRFRGVEASSEEKRFRGFFKAGTVSPLHRYTIVYYIILYYTMQGPDGLHDLHGQGEVARLHALRPLLRVRGLRRHPGRAGSGVHKRGV